jgi:hypothetical protein
LVREQLTPLLQHAGHDVVTMDSPSEDGSASFDTYDDVVCAAHQPSDKRHRDGADTRKLS